MSVEELDAMLKMRLPEDALAGRYYGVAIKDMPQETAQRALAHLAAMHHRHLEESKDRCRRLFG